jgi:alpha,alpha-trehalose phosphorylase
VLTLETGELAELTVRGKPVQVTAEASMTIPLQDQGPRLPGTPAAWVQEGVRRTDGSLITASVPNAS